MAKNSFTPQKINFKESLRSLKYIPRFFQEIRKVNPTLFFLNILTRLISALLPLLMLWIGKLIIDEVVLQIDATTKSFTYLAILVSAEFVLAIASDLLSRAINYTDSLLGDQYSIHSSVKIIKKTAQLNLDQLEDADFYDKLERARRQTSGRVSLMSNVLSQIQDLIVVFSLLIGIVSFEAWLILLLIISVLPTIINEIKFNGTSYSLSKSWTQERRELDYLRYAGASDMTAKEVKLFGLSDYIAERFETLSHQYFLESKALAKRRALWGSFFNIISNLAYYAAYILIVFNTIGGLLSLGDLTFLSASFNRLRTKLQGFFTRFTSITDKALYLNDYFEFLDLRSEYNSLNEKREMPKRILKGFEFRNVGFKYPQSDSWVVRNINFELRAGEKLAFVGENGAGKTTLTKLLLRFYEPSEGEILLDGIPVSEYDINEYQTYFGVIFQDFVKFELTLRENVAVGAIDEIENQEKIDEVAQKSLANTVVEKLPMGYEQPLGRRFKKGKELSGGEWQKVAMARAYMKDAEVLILDEPTSALDARAETETFNRFINLTKGKTSVIISHRFSTVRIADRIMVLKNGRVEELGTHDELMEKDALYAELFKLQAVGYL